MTRIPVYPLGDGQDDTAHIQALICEHGLDALEFRPGTFTLSKPLTDRTPRD